MDKVLLFSLHTDQIKVTIEAYFDPMDSLIIDGYDIGKKVKEYWGDSDYEYTTTIRKEEVEKLYPLFHLEPTAKQELLLALQRDYNTNTCYSELQNLLDRNSIKYEGFSWR